MTEKSRACCSQTNNAADAWVSCPSFSASKNAATPTITIVLAPSQRGDEVTNTTMSNARGSPLSVAAQRFKRQRMGPLFSWHILA